ncbi:hypothetical protein TWF706_007148 [Orbilia oligospora]|uniref:Uncharacterized protein n=1 Tax=Orbilia oligospora TaxID=2813651 RepID=A0A7C8NUN6_ORBOL|nr:hypothetical protein TWF706_007148 [Orbilia oligospora]KAF3133449.1 hypothetical protein TWF703_006988 [Orbilia oligospora]
MYMATTTENFDFDRPSTQKIGSSAHKALYSMAAFNMTQEPTFNELFRRVEDLTAYESEPESESTESMDKEQWVDDDDQFQYVHNERVRQETVDKLADMKRVSDLYYKSPGQKRAEEQQEELERLITEEPDSEDGGIGDRVRQRRSPSAKSHENVEGAPGARKRGRPAKN